MCSCSQSPTAECSRMCAVLRKARELGHISLKAAAHTRRGSDNTARGLCTFDTRRIRTTVHCNSSYVTKDGTQQCFNFRAWSIVFRPLSPTKRPLRDRLHRNNSPMSTVQDPVRALFDRSSSPFTKDCVHLGCFRDSKRVASGSNHEHTQPGNQHAHLATPLHASVRGHRGCEPPQPPRAPFARHSCCGEEDLGEGWTRGVGNRDRSGWCRHGAVGLVSRRAGCTLWAAWRAPRAGQDVGWTGRDRGRRSKCGPDAWHEGNPVPVVPLLVLLKWSTKDGSGCWNVVLQAL